MPGIPFLCYKSPMYQKSSGFIPSIFFNCYSSFNGVSFAGISNYVSGGFVGISAALINYAGYNGTGKIALQFGSVNILESNRKDNSPVIQLGLLNFLESQPDKLGASVIQIGLWNNNNGQISPIFNLKRRKSVKLEKLVE
jgi:hypothetical protein